MSEATKPKSGRPGIFCISTYEKGQAFLREAARQDCDVTLLTVDKLRDADWPKDVLAEFLTMPENLTPGQILNTVSWLARTRRIDRIVALDEFDLEAAALLREHMRLPGLDESNTRFFRDKLAMRTEARRGGIPVPEFTSTFFYDDLRAFMRHVPGPWLLKPRTNASAIGIRTIATAEQLWPVLEELGDLGSHYLLERFLPGEVFHVEGVTSAGKVLFAAPFQYGRPPIETMHQGGIFSTQTISDKTPDGRALVKMHKSLLASLHLQSGVTHTEFIKARADGKFYFLETAARVGGAYIAEVVELATGLNPWVEWARLETSAARGTRYSLPVLHNKSAGSVISLARQDVPDLAAYTDPEIGMRLHKAHHAGLLVSSDSEKRVRELVASYTERFVRDFLAILPAPDKPTA